MYEVLPLSLGAVEASIVQSGSNAAHQGDPGLDTGLSLVLTIAAAAAPVAPEVASEFGERMHASPVMSTKLLSSECFGSTIAELMWVKTLDSPGQRTS